ncbi:hypothetical protein R3P38DRAFT_3279500 [Favolaschia claudopus]|uniref:Uncharacterized protein n=1 Tax=Favolaschia claudopus TaxID=2862362 RepID=A0AAW0ALD4_9AGAR
MQAPPRDAIFSGYSMSHEDLRDFTLALDPAYEKYLEKHPDRVSWLAYVSQYLAWRDSLGADIRKSVPTIKSICSQVSQLLLVLTSVSNIDITALPANAEPDAPASRRYFFSTRWIPAPDNVTIKDYPEAARETEEDRVKRDQLIALIKQDTGYSVATERLLFETTKYTHPFYDVFTYY